MEVFSNLKIKHKISLVTAILFTLTAGYLYLSLRQVKINLVETRKAEMVTAATYTATLASLIYQATIENYLRGTSETLIKGVQHFHDQFQQGLITESDAKSKAEQWLLSNTVGGSGYAIAVDISGGQDDISFAVHPFLKGNKIAHTDVGQRMFEQRTGYLEFEWSNDPNQPPALKAQYMNYFEPWQWIVSVAPFKNEFFELINIDVLQFYLAEAQSKKIDSSYVTLFDSSGNTLYHPVLNNVNILGLRDTKTGDPIIENLIDRALDKHNPQTTGWIEYNYTARGESTGPSSEKIFYYQYIPEYDWFSVSIINKRDLELGYNQLIQNITVLSLAAMLIIIAITLGAIRNFSNRFKPLISSVHKLARNDYNIVLKRSANDEIGELEAAFTHAVSKIAQLTQAQTMLNESLEATINERTLELEQKNQQLEVLYVTDALTGLSNRRKIDEVLQKEREYAKRYGSPLSLVIFDVDHFKQVNDRFGHLNGDQALIAIGKVLQTHSRISDVCGRWGGEEFVIICPATDLEGAAIMAEKIRGLIECISIPEVGKITASFGVATMGAEFSIDQLIHQADDNMYLAKNQGRNCVVSAPPEA